jgi:hypothetical protein
MWYVVDTVPDAAAEETDLIERGVVMDFCTGDLANDSIL